MYMGTKMLLTTLILLLLSAHALALEVNRDEADPETLIWVNSGITKHPDVYENLLAFAQRHHVSVMLAWAYVRPGPYTDLELALQTAKQFGVEAWLNTGCFQFKDGWAAGQLVDDAATMGLFQGYLRDQVSVYNRYYPDGKVLLWHEEPLMSNWSANPKVDLSGNVASGSPNMLKYGPTIFRAERDVVRSVNANLKVGLFVHHPAVSANTYNKLMAALQEQNTMPDFAFLDVYRGYNEIDNGPDRVNAYLENVIAKAKRLNVGPVFFLGEDHTINSGYTPSKKAIRDDLDAALAGGADGVGWYIRTLYKKTFFGFDSFLPNRGEVDGELFNTFTGSRDRFMYAYLATFEKQVNFSDNDVFDLWIYGSDFDFHESRLYLRSNMGEWDFIGDFGTYVPGQYGLEDKTGAVAFHALSRNRYIRGDNTVEMKVVPKDESDGQVVKAVYVMPYFNSSVYVTEQEITELIDVEPAAAASFSLGSLATSKELQAGEEWVQRIALPKVRNRNPDLTFLNLAPDQVVSNAVTVYLESVEDAGDFNRVLVEIDGAEVFKGDSWPPSLVVDPAALADGRHEIHAAAQGIDGHVVDSVVEFRVDTVKVALPPGKAVYQGEVPVEISINRPVEEVAEVVVAIEDAVIYRGNGSPQDLIINTLQLADRSHKLTVNVKTTHGLRFGKEVFLTVKNWRELHDQLLPPLAAWLGTLDRSKTTEVSSGWDYDSSSPDSFSGDDSRRVRTSNSDEYLVWEVPHMNDFRVTVFSPVEEISSVVKIFGSNDGSGWQELPYQVAAEKLTGGLWKLELTGELEQRVDYSQMKLVFRSSDVPFSQLQLSDVFVRCREGV